MCKNYIKLKSFLLSSVIFSFLSVIDSNILKQPDVPSRKYLYMGQSIILDTINSTVFYFPRSREQPPPPQKEDEIYDWNKYLKCKTSIFFNFLVFLVSCP